MYTPHKLNTNKIIMKFSSLFEVKMSPQTTLQQENIDDVLVGFEIECILSIRQSSKLNKEHEQSVFQREIRMQLLQDDAIKNFIHDAVDDGSLEGFREGEIPIEVITKPMKYTQAIQNLQLIFKHLQQKYNMRTNDTCSLHVNLSCEGTRNNTIDMMKLVAFLGEDHFLKLFNRDDNEFTHEMKAIFNTIIPEEITPSTYVINMLKDKQTEILKLVTKYFAVNPNKLQNGYLEFRIMGGKNYEQNISKITLATSHFAHIMLIASSNAYNKEYNTKLTKILNKLIELEYQPDTSMFKVERDILNLIIKYNPSLKRTMIDTPDIPSFLLHNFEYSMLRGVDAKRKQHILYYFSTARKKQTFNNEELDFLVHIIHKLGWRRIVPIHTLEDAIYVINFNVPYNKDKVYRDFGRVINTLSDDEFDKFYSILHNICKNDNKFATYTKTHLLTYIERLKQFSNITRNRD